MPRLIDYEVYYDKVLGGWIGKCAGGNIGAPIEGFKRFNEIKLTEELLKNKYPNDDMDLQIVWLDLLKKKGPDIRDIDMAEHWRKHVHFPWGEYGIATRNLKLGIYPPFSGDHNNHYWREGMGSPIRSEIWGMINPGDPISAMYNAMSDSMIDHIGFSMEAERFLAALAAEAFFEDNLPAIIEKVIPHIHQEGPMKRLVTYLLDLYPYTSYENAIGKFKCRYGDADFTNGPMNVGFILLSLLYHAAEFDNLVHALNLGHDSDCICATIGAIYGIIKGASNIDPKWKKMVGNELLASPEIVGIDYPKTLEKLAEETCRVGIAFTEINLDVEITGKKPQPYSFDVTRYNLFGWQENYDPYSLDEFQEMFLVYENMDMEVHEVRLVFQSDYLIFKNEVINFIHYEPNKYKFSNEFRLNKTGAEQIFYIAVPEYQFPSIPYTITVWINGDLVEELERGIPYYGAWMLIGPFIQDDPALAPLDSKYPDHGLASLPSCQYMNRDRLNLDTDFITTDQCRDIARHHDYPNYPFDINTYYPAGFKMDLSQFYAGQGEKTLYLYTKIFSLQSRKVWMVMGCSGFIKVFLNSEPVFERREIRRSWPYDISIEAELHSGINDILIRIDMPLGTVDFEFGFKEFTGKHPHQSHWDTELVPFV